MAINNSLLREKLKKVEAEFNCALSVDKARTLIKKIQKKYPCSQKKRFKSLVEKIAKSLQLAEYSYCRVAFCYFGSSKKKKKYKEEKIKKQQQMFFNLYNPTNWQV